MKLLLSFNIKRACFLLFLGYLVVLTNNSTLAQGRKVISFNTDWKFNLADDPIFSKTVFDDSQWSSLNLPHDWSIEGKYDKSNSSGPHGGYLPCGIGWYRKSFSLPESEKGKRFFIRFDGVYMNSSVWINNRMVGSYPNGYNSFGYDITTFINFGDGQKNVVSLKVDNSLQPATRWYSGSGIYRNIWLISTEQLHFKTNGVFVTTPEVSKESATVHIDYHLIANAYPETVFNWTDNTSLFVWVNKKESKDQKTNDRVQKKCTLSSAFFDQRGNEVARKVSEHLIGDFTEPYIQVELMVKNPNLWSAKTPSMYRLVSTISYDDKIIDQLETPIGIRKLEFTPEKGMLVNGVQEKLKGICFYQSMGCL